MSRACFQTGGLNLSTSAHAQDLENGLEIYSEKSLEKTASTTRIKQV